MAYDRANEKFNNFKRMRIKRGYTQSTLAADTGLSLRAVQYADQHGANGMACGSARKVATVLHCLIEDLLDDEDYTKQRRGKKAANAEDTEDSPE